MSKNAQLDAIRVEKNRQRVLECAFTLFAEHGIDSMSMPEIAKAVKMDRSSIYRYFPTKLDLAVAISANMWKQYTALQYERTEINMQTAAQRYEFWLDRFLDLYRDHRDLLRFNQFFNVYVANTEAPAEKMEPYTGVIAELEKQFHDVYELGRKDGTLRADIPEKSMFSVTLHLMLAAVTRYAVGLVYQSGSDPEAELHELKNMMMSRFTTQETETENPRGGF